MPTAILNLCNPHAGTNVNYASDLVVYVNTGKMVS